MNHSNYSYKSSWNEGNNFYAQYLVCVACTLSIRLEIVMTHFVSAIHL